MPKTPEPPSDNPKPQGAAARRVTLEAAGPVLVEGPVEVVLDDGAIARSDRFMVALCTCRRSRTYPWCDTSHRPRVKGPSQSEDRNPS
ncbi:CDGSH iron-sulfur domain-containing protein [Streptomyces roseus]|uniref:CDGSH iron-sulfur domain-containing protein n=1 Tax=Streptomyces roseus TaxID=66430 RepID=UPI0033D62D52